MSTIEYDYKVKEINTSLGRFDINVTYYNGVFEKAIIRTGGGETLVCDYDKLSEQEFLDTLQACMEMWGAIHD